ncbi:HD domain-containing protein [bacterium]|nr:HD domain-containing protein [bacterium]
MSKQMVADLQPNQTVSSFFAVSQRSLIPFKNKSGSYLDLLLSDRSGSVIGRVWDGAEQIAEVCQPGSVVKVEGRVDEYRGKLQIIVEDVAPAEPGEYDRADMLEAAARDTGELLSEVFEFLGQVSNPYLRQLLESFFGDDAFVQAFAEAPGAKRQHHAHLGGLLEHTVSVVKLLSTVCELHPQLDRDLLIAGGLLHDIGKLAEFDTGVTIEYTDIGRLVGHIVITDRWVRERIAQIPDFPPELDNRLNHVLLSHHGQKEYGAPIVPMTAEACALHYADNLDAHVQYFVHEISKGGASGNSWTEYQKLFDRYLYIGSPEAPRPDPNEPGQP